MSKVLSTRQELKRPKWPENGAVKEEGRMEAGAGPEARRFVFFFFPAATILVFLGTHPGSLPVPHQAHSVPSRLINHPP